VSLDDSDYAQLKVRRRPTPDGSVPDVELRSVDDGMPLLAELEAFVGHVVGGPPPLTSFADELRMLDVLSDLRRMAGLDTEHDEDGERVR